MKKIISFSLYGNKPNFQVGAIVNVLEAKRLYPDWKCRFYTTDDEAICKQLEYLGAEIVRMDDWPDGNMFWRFLALDDSDVCISRDADSVVNERELGAVNEWLASDKQWHMMHDHRNHRQPMMGGMWGFKKAGMIGFNKKTIREHIEEWISLGNTSEGYGHDQNFLKQIVYPLADGSSLKHGNFGKPFPDHAPCRYGRFVGDYSFFIQGWGGLANGDKDVTTVYFEKQKFKKSRGACIYHNLGLGDHIIMNGAVRYILKKERLDEIRVVCKESNYQNVGHMFRDDPRIRVITISNKNRPSKEWGAANWINWHTSHTLKSDIDFEVKNLSYIASDFEKGLYKNSCVPYEERFNSFYFERDPNRESKLLSHLDLPDKYCLVCDNRFGDIKNLEITTDLPIVCFEKIQDDLIFDWIPVIEGASEIHSINTSFFHLVNQINTKCNKIYHKGFNDPEVNYEGWQCEN